MIKRVYCPECGRKIRGWVAEGEKVACPASECGHTWRIKKTGKPSTSNRSRVNPCKDWIEK